jgi:hypothetical protein
VLHPRSGIRGFVTFRSYGSMSRRIQLLVGVSAWDTLDWTWAIWTGKCRCGGDQECAEGKRQTSEGWVSLCGGVDTKRACC